MNNKRLEEIEARLAAAPTIPKNTFQILYDMGYDSEKEPHCRLIANAPADIRDLLAIVKLQREALRYISRSATMQMTGYFDDKGEFIKKTELHKTLPGALADKVLEAADKILGDT